MTLRQEELDRYKRQILIEGWGVERQEQLKRASVFVAGAGGLGSPVLFYLAAAGLGRITICDDDLVSLSNLNRQIIHPLSALDRSKAESSAEAVLRFNPDVQVVALSSRISKDNAGSLIDGHDVIVDCLDNLETRLHVNRAAVAKRMPLVHAGIFGMGGQVTFIQPPETACLACLFRTDNVSANAAVVGCTPGILGSIQALETIKFLTGIGDNLKNRLLVMDGKRLDFDIVEIARDPECPVCGK